MRMKTWWDDLRRDVGYGLRQIRRRPGFAAVVILTLGLGIGASTSIFSLVDGVVLRPLPYRDAEHLVAVWETYPHWREREDLGEYWDRIPLAWPDYERWREGTEAFNGVAVWSTTSSALTGHGDPRRVTVGRASASLFSVAGVDAVLGRTFLPGEDGPGAPRLALISHALWEQRFGAARDVLDRPVALDGHSFRIVGVLPRGVGVLTAEAEEPHVWVPVGSTGAYLGEDNHSFRGVGRIAAGTTTEAARIDVARLLRGERAPERLGVQLVPLRKEVVGEVRSGLLVLLGASLLLLVIACVNASALLAGEAARREREIAARAALGAGRGRIARQLVAESIVLAGVAAAVGVGLAYSGTRGLLAVAPPEVPRLDVVAVDLRVLAFAVGISVAAGVLSGVGPGLALVRTDLLSVLGGGSRATEGRQRRAHTVVVGSQLAVLMVLLTGAGLLARSLLEVTSVDPGFRTEGVLTALVDLPDTRYGDPAAVTGFYDRVLQRLEAVPGVAGASAVSVAPFTGERGSNSVRTREMPDEGPKPEAERRVVVGDYFRTMEIPILAGRAFEPAELGGEVATVVVSESLARRLWPGRPALGERLEYQERWYAVVGVAGDIRDRGLARKAEPTFYVPHRAAPEAFRRMRLMVAPGGADAAGLGAPVRQAVSDVDPALPLSEVATLKTLARRSLAPERYRTFLVAVFAGIAMILAAMGMFGVAMRAVRRGRRSIGIRIAVGAPPTRVALEVLSRTLVGAVLGLGAGGLAMGAASPVLTDFLYSVPARDAATFATSALALLAVAVAATWIPARRATRVDPVRALRAE